MQLNRKGEREVNYGDMRQDRNYRGQDSNSYPPEYEQESLLLDPELCEVRVETEDSRDVFESDGDSSRK
jgi:hypothetical protein